MKRFVEILLYLWQLPQNLAGLLLVAVFGWCIPIDYRGNNHHLPSSLVFIREKMRGGISLGRYIIMNDRLSDDIRVYQHERGHSIQSMILGPLYLFVIGLPSILWAAWWNEDRGLSYYWFYTERWADHLGGTDHGL